MLYEVITNQLDEGISHRLRHADLKPLLAPLEGVAGSYSSWAWLTVLSMLAIMFLPRQFQVTVIENKDERHLNKAIWLFPVYMLAINIFVLPIAFGGRLHFAGGGVDADTFVITSYSIHYTKLYEHCVLRIVRERNVRKDRTE